MGVAPAAVMTKPRKRAARKQIKPIDYDNLVEEKDPEFGPLPPELWPKVDHLVTEDDTPVDNFYSEKQQKLSTHTVYATPHPFGEGRSFIAVANIGLYASPDFDPQVPDVMISLDVSLPADIWQKGNRAYMVWLFHKSPEVVIEIVSNKTGGEDTTRMQRYEEMRIAYYVIYDPAQQLSKQVLRVYEIRGTEYVLRKDAWLPGIGLGLVLWKGKFEDREDTWLRWCDSDGNLLLTGEERAEQESQRAEQESQRAEQESQRAEQESQRAEQESQRAQAAETAADQERQRVERLMAQLRALGVEPDVNA